MEINIEKYIKEKWKRIADLVFDKYDWIPLLKNNSILLQILDWILDWWYSLHKIEVEIYSRCLQESNAFFVNNTELKFDDELLNIIKFRLECRLKYPKEIRKMTPEKMLANAINIIVIDFLFDRDFII